MRSFWAYFILVLSFHAASLIWHPIATNEMPLTSRSVKKETFRLRLSLDSFDDSTKRKDQNPPTPLPKVTEKRPKKRPPEKHPPDLPDDAEMKRQETAASKSTDTYREVSYAQKLKRYLESKTTYPKIARRLRQGGTVKIRLTIHKSGHFREVSIISPSPFHSLNNAAVSLLKNLKKFEPLPYEGRDLESFIIPIVYQLNDQS